MNESNCKICNRSPILLCWTDTHGVAQCHQCGTPYRVYFYEGEKRVEKPMEIQIKAEYIPLIKRYWDEQKRRMPSGCSFPGGQEVASQDDARAFYEWMEQHAPAKETP